VLSAAAELAAHCYLVLRPARATVRPIAERVADEGAATAVGGRHLLATATATATATASYAEPSTRPDFAPASRRARAADVRRRRSRPVYGGDG
jgi:hypothetical protein